MGERLEDALDRSLPTGDHPGPGSARPEAPRRAVRARLCAPRHRGDPRGVPRRSSPGVDGRHDPRRARQHRERRRLRSAGLGARRGRGVPQAPARGPRRVRHARHVRGGDGSLWNRGEHPRTPAGQLVRQGHARPRRPGLRRELCAVLGLCGKRRRPVLAGKEERHAARARAPRRRFVPFRARRGDGSAGPGARDPGPGDRVPDRRPGTSERHRDHLPAGDDAPRSGRGSGDRAGRPLCRAVGDRERVRRAEEPPAGLGGRAQVEDARRCAPRGVGLPVHPLRHPSADGERRHRCRRGPGPDQLHPHAPRGTSQRTRWTGNRKRSAHRSAADDAHRDLSRARARPAAAGSGARGEEEDVELRPQAARAPHLAPADRARRRCGAGPGCLTRIYGYWV